MTDRVNRKDLIIDTASQLFMQHGYTSTSVRQIAEATEMTEAALYYHFKGGKRELLQAVIECQIPDMLGIIERCSSATSLKELLHDFVVIVTEDVSTRMEKMRWIVAEFPRFSDDEKQVFFEKHITFRNGLRDLIAQFVDDPERVETMTWLVVCSVWGYNQIFWHLGACEIVDFPSDKMATLLAESLS